MKTIILHNSINDLTEELKGYTLVRFVNWHPDIYLSYSVGDEQAKPLRKGMKMGAFPPPLLYKTTSNQVVLELELSN